MDHMVRAAPYHNSDISRYNSGFYLRMQTSSQKLHLLVHPLGPREKAGDFAGFCFPGAGGGEGMTQALSPRVWGWAEGSCHSSVLQRPVQPTCRYPWT